MEDLERLREELTGAVAGVADTQALEELRVSALGKKGSITGLMKGLGGMNPDQRRAMGQSLNALKVDVADAIEARKLALEAAELDAELEIDRIDVTLPVRPEMQGRIHPISQTIDEIVAVLGEMGFTIAEGPDIEDDWHNFTALNIPPDHPARQEHDTFYLRGESDAGRMVLRTHTSPVQIRSMQNGEPPFRLIVPGRTYRCDYDATHSPMFHQVGGWSSIRPRTWAPA